MKYCYNCDRTTIGEPLFCNFCGRSYNIKLCPKLHMNPREAEACSRCGSRDLSVPQPRVPLWMTLLSILVIVVSGLILGFFSLLTITFFVRHLLKSPHALVAFAFVETVLGILWWGWTEIPRVLRGAIHKTLQRRRHGEER